MLNFQPQQSSVPQEKLAPYAFPSTGLLPKAPPVSGALKRNHSGIPKGRTPVLQDRVAQFKDDVVYAALADAFFPANNTRLMGPPKRRVKEKGIQQLHVENKSIQNTNSVFTVYNEKIERAIAKAANTAGFQEFVEYFICSLDVDSANDILMEIENGSDAVKLIFEIAFGRYMEGMPSLAQHMESLVVYDLTSNDDVEAEAAQPEAISTEPAPELENTPQQIVEKVPFVHRTAQQPAMQQFIGFPAPAVNPNIPSRNYSPKRANSIKRTSPPVCSLPASAMDDKFFLPQDDDPTKTNRQGPFDKEGLVSPPGLLSIISSKFTTTEQLEACFIPEVFPDCLPKTVQPIIEREVAARLRTFELSPSYTPDHDGSKGKALDGSGRKTTGSNARQEYQSACKSYFRKVETFVKWKFFEQKVESVIKNVWLTAYATQPYKYWELLDVRSRIKQTLDDLTKDINVKILKMETSKKKMEKWVLRGRC